MRRTLSDREANLIAEEIKKRCRPKTLKSFIKVYINILFFKYYNWKTNNE